MRGAERSPANQHVGRIANDQRPVRDADGLAVREVLPGRVGSRMVILDRRPAQADGVVERTRREDVLASKPGVAVHPTRLPNADLGPQRDQRRMLIAGNPVDQEPDVLEGLATAGHFRLGQEPRVRGVDDPAVRIAPEGVEAGHHGRDYPVDRRDVVAPFEPGQVVRP